MTPEQKMWIMSRDRLTDTMEQLGFSKELGNMLAKQLGSPKAIDRMNAYLIYEKPSTEELVVDEMLAICAEIDAWKKKKAAEEANARYNEIINTEFEI